MFILASIVVYSVDRSLGTSEDNFNIEFVIARSE